MKLSCYFAHAFSKLLMFCTVPEGKRVRNRSDSAATTVSRLYQEAAERLCNYGLPRNVALEAVRVLQQAVSLC